MTDIAFETVDTGDVSLNVATAGDRQAPVLICLHGFPEYWAAWADMWPLLAHRFCVIMPDLRGYNLSSKPTDPGAYGTRELVADLAVLADRYSPDRPFLLAGHDWGASLAYAYAFRNSDRLQGLVIANGVHPWCFQNAILTDPEQRRASQYINRLRLREADRFMAENEYARTLKMMTGFSSADWMTDDKRAGYLRAWSQPDALPAMLNWYRGSPVVVPEPGEEVATAPILEIGEEALTVRVPHLVVWGSDDQALRPSCLDGLDRFAADLTVERVAGSGHWILHEKPDFVADAIFRFCDRL